MSTTLIDMHIRYGGLSAECVCARSACGARLSGPNIPAVDCPVDHLSLTGMSHAAYDCPKLPADADLSGLWILVLTNWERETGWTTATPHPFDRALLSRLRGSGVIWQVAEGATGPDAVSAWRATFEALRSR